MKAPGEMKMSIDGQTYPVNYADDSRDYIDIDINHCSLLNRVESTSREGIEIRGLIKSERGLLSGDEFDI